MIFRHFTNKKSNQNGTEGSEMFILSYYLIIQ